LKGFHGEEKLSEDEESRDYYIENIQNVYGIVKGQANGVEDHIQGEPAVLCQLSKNYLEIL